MSFKIKNKAFANYTGCIGKVSFQDGVTQDIPDRMDIDMINAVIGVEEVKVDLDPAHDNSIVEEGIQEPTTPK